MYCASSGAVVPRYGERAFQVGVDLAQAGVGLVYGGGSVGLMGRVAEGALSVGGEVIGVIPERLQALELGHGALTELHVVPDMHTRKARMADLSDAFVALPGGWGTWEELFEAVTWTQLGYHRKPVGVLDWDGYYAPLRALVERALAEGFLRSEVAPILSFGEALAPLLAQMATMDVPPIERWLTAP